MNKATALQQVNAAQLELDELLTKGSDTLEARRILKIAQHELNIFEKKENNDNAKAASNKKSALQREAAQITEEAIKDLNQKLDDLVNIKTPALSVPPHLAENVLLAHERLSVAQKDHHALQAEIEELRQRQTEIQTKRQEIINRRAAGSGDDETDGPALALIQADTENLNDLINRKVSNTNIVDTARQERAIAEAQQAFSSAINVSYVECLQNLIEQFEPSLVATAQELLNIVGIQGSASKRYQPCNALKNAVKNNVF